METQERAIHYFSDSLVEVGSMLVALIIIMGLLFTGGFGLPMTEALLMFSVVLLVLVVGIPVVLSRQRAKVDSHGMAPEWLGFCRVKETGVIPWTDIEKVEFRRYGRAWTVFVYLKNRKNPAARHELFPPDFEQPGVVVEIVKAHFPVELPEERG